MALGDLQRLESTAIAVGGKRFELTRATVVAIAITEGIRLDIPIYFSHVASPTGR